MDVPLRGGCFAAPHHPLSGGKNTHIATLVERQSRFVLLVHVEGKDSDSVVSALVRQVKHLPAGL
ncbi:MAG TPA: hypothetical protein VII24_05495, partial [Pseudolabrys sp.]